MKIVVLLSRVPYPLIKGDKLRAFNQLKELAKQHEVSLFALNDGPLNDQALEHLRPICKEVKIVQLSKWHIMWNLLYTFLFTQHPLQTAYFYNKRTQQQLDSWIEKIEPDHLYCQLIRTTEYVKNINTIPKTLDYMDSLSSGMQRRVNKAPWYLRWLFRLEALRLKRYEYEIFDYFDNKTIIAERDQELIINYRNKEITVVENGVDKDWFFPKQMDKKHDLLFTGNMSYPPNVECVRYLVKEILPEVWRTRPQTTLVIAGANPGRKLKELANDRIIFTEWVEDIRTYYWQSKLFIAPMQIGSGLQNKLLEAMSMKLPCITSKLANKSLMAKDKEEILIGHNTATYAELIIDLLHDSKKADFIAENGHRFVRAHFDWKVSVAKLNVLFNKKRETA
jgi:sugar transferase (PEP-CTERM/EpsH1 system associated)